MTHTGPATVTVAAKIPATLAASLEALTAMHGLSRSAVIRELIAGAVDGAPGFPSEEARAARATGIINARIRQHVRRVEDHAAATRQSRTTYGLHDLLHASVEKRLGRPPGASRTLVGAREAFAAAPSVDPAGAPMPRSADA
jgi:hypothetical protein